MYGLFFNTKEDATTNKGFSNQSDVLSHVNPEEREKGLCAQLANLYTKEQMAESNTGSPTFLNGNSQEIYDAALKERRHQEQLFKEGKDGLHSAFVDSKTPYLVSTDKIKVSDLTSESLAKLVDKAGPNHIVTYPVKNAAPSQHTIAFGKSKDRQSCYSFSANFPPKQHPCDAFLDLAKEIRELGDQDETVILATNYRK